MATRDELDEWLVRMASGDRQALSPLHHATSAKLSGLALRILGDRAEAGDARQEIHVKAWLNADRLEVSRFSPMTWLCTIARNHAVDGLRRRGRRPAEPMVDGTDLLALRAGLERPGGPEAPRRRAHGAGRVSLSA